MSEPSVLTYARFFKLTQEVTYDAVNYVDTTKKHKQDCDVADFSIQNSTALLELFRRSAEEHISLIHDDQLIVSQAVTEYLKTCTTVSTPNHDLVYKTLLPNPYRLRNLKLELPILLTGGGDATKDARKIRKGIDTEILLDDILYEDDETNVQDGKLVRSGQIGELTASTTSTDLQEWARRQVEAMNEVEKLEINTSSVKYLRSILNATLVPDHVSHILQSTCSRAEMQSSQIIPMLREDDISIETVDDSPSSSHFPEINENDFEGSPLCVSKKRDILSQLDAAVNDELFTLDEHTDKEIEDLFRELTYHHSDDRSLTTSQSKDTTPPAAKRRKLNQTEVTNFSSSFPQSGLRAPEVPLRHLKLAAPSVGVCQDVQIRVNDPLATIVQNRNEAQHPQIRIDFESAPFRIPQIIETLKEPLNSQTRLLDKYLTNTKSVISSDKLLYKEPGIRILDISEETNEAVTTEDYASEDEADLSVRPEPNPSLRANSSYYNVGRRSSVSSISSVKTEHVLPLPCQDDLPPLEAETKVNCTQREVKRSKLEQKAESQVTLSNSNSLISNHPQHENASLIAHRNPEKPFPRHSKAPIFESLVPRSKRDLYVTPGEIKEAYPSGDSLSSFLDLRGKYKSAQHKFKPEEIVDDPILSTQNIPTEQIQSDETLVPSPQISLREQQEIVPMIAPMEEPRTIVLNSVLLQSRPLLIQFLERIGRTSLTLIYRDIDPRQCNSPDIILNATTCLCITNLQALNQRPLPGQKIATGLSPMHDRIAELSSAYSLVVVLVHYTNETELAAENKTALAQACFAAFCAKMASEPRTKHIQPYWLPCVKPASASEIVNAWVWHIIGRHALRSPTGDFSKNVSGLIQDETLWEIFLCRAGLNPLAAQLVIGRLKKTSVAEGKCRGEDPSWGMRKLVAMGPQNRVSMFGSIIGGEVVERLNRALLGQ